MGEIYGAPCRIDLDAHLSVPQMKPIVLLFKFDNYREVLINDFQHDGSGWEFTFPAESDIEYYTIPYPPRI